MANVDKPFGLKPIMRTLEGGEEKFRWYPKSSGYATALFRYDAVTRQGTGYCDKAITPGTTQYLGVVMVYSAASTADNVPVLDSPSAQFEAQMSAAAMASIADLGLNANLVLTAGDATLKTSKHAVNSSTVATTADLDVKILRKTDEIDNEWGSYARVVVKFNRHILAHGVAGV